MTWCGLCRAVRDADLCTACHSALRGVLGAVGERQRAAFERVDRLRAELSAAEREVPRGGNSQHGAGGGGGIGERLAEVEKRLAIEAAMRDLNLTEEQAAAAHTLAKSNDLTLIEAVEVAKLRDRKLFANDAQAAQFGSLSPRPGGPRPQQRGPTIQDHIAHAVSLKASNNREAKARANNIAGHFLAEAMGWEHTMMDLPREL